MKYFKSKETKKFFGFFMALAMVISMMPGVASAKVATIKKGTTTTTVTAGGITVDIDAKGVTITGASINLSDLVFDVTVTGTSVAATTASVTVKVPTGYVVVVSESSLSVTDGTTKDKDELVFEKSVAESYAKFIFEGKLVVKKNSAGSIADVYPGAPSTSATPSPSAPADTTAPSPSAPADTTAPSPSAPADTTAPTESVAPTKAPAKTVKVGTKKTVNGGKYKVTKGNKVTYTAPAKKTAKVTIPATVKINGVTCKVTTIGKGAFKGNTKIKTVSLGKNITKIEANAFKGCKNLKTITIKSTGLTKKNVAKTAFKGINKKATFKVPAKKVKAYKTVVKYAGAPKTVKVKK